MPTGDIYKTVKGDYYGSPPKGNYYSTCKKCGAMCQIIDMQGLDICGPCHNVICAEGRALFQKAIGNIASVEEIPTPPPITNDEPRIESKELDILLEELANEQEARDRANTLVVNLFGGPGCGKSSIAAGIFHDLKWQGVECEMALEFAKDLVWEARHQTFDDQIYLFGKQHHRIFRLLGQVQVVITDCPILLSPIYDKEKRSTFKRLVVEEHDRMWTYNVFLKRLKPYRKLGRLHDEEQAKELDRDIVDLLTENSVCFEVIDGSPEGKDAIVKKVSMLLEWRKNK